MKDELIENKRDKLPAARRTLHTKLKSIIFNPNNLTLGAL